MTAATEPSEYLLKKMKSGRTNLMVSWPIG